MQFSESWLRTLVNPSLSSEELSHLLTMAGLEVEEMTSVAPAFDKVVVAQVLSKEKHPDADRLNVLTVNVGQTEPLTIVCGAGNVSVGMKAPCALVGARLPGIEIKQAKVRGVASFGMMCSEKELGLAETSDGLMVLAEDALVGQSIREYLDLNDHLITLKLTPNRSDCLSLNGIAREVAALTGAAMQAFPQATFKQTGKESRKIKLAAAAACPRYTGRVISGVNAKATTPAWMVQRLQRCGLRSISALVDVTNYVLLELGQPLHAFDLNKLNGDIDVRFARAGEKLKLLNEQTVDLQDDMLVIADGKGPVALAGVMGGADSAVDDATTDIFLESAFFVPSVIVGKSRRLGFGSDSSYRFERGVDFAATQLALDRATQLILDICGGQAGAMVEVQGELPVRHAVKLRTSRVHRVLGIALQEAEIALILNRLGMAYQQTGEEFSVTPPSYRFDIAIEEDLIEEVARVHGYEKIEPAPIQARMSILPLVEAERPLAKLRQNMVLRDYQETINYSFVEAEWERDLCGNSAPIALKNPIASQMSVMRSSLLGGLIAALRTNLARKQPRVRLFEIGGCFAAEAGSYAQDERLAGLAYGGAVAEQWGVAGRNVDFYDVKGDVEAIFAPRTLTFQVAEHPASHPGRSARILLEGRAIGWIGELHPQWQQQYDLPQAVVWFEIELAALIQSGVPRLQNISRFPPVRRDVAVLVDENVTVQSLVDVMRAEQVPNVVEVALFDVYRGKGVEQGKKSLAFRVLLQDTQKTLMDAEIEEKMSRLVAALQRQGAQLRV
ncbi:MAG: phenylalanine--tRNA ligase subunit beta [Gammaproteobacteria bacterium]|nr:phenylalanine--tRNA ligase subunit beta [Gammaproteobacteria bacterium]MBU1968710.1 phenylalanine--tRNA ligase subunit beta [Gammaproteobacteria bacterium]